MGQHGQGGPAVPGTPAAHLVLVQATQALAGLEALLHRPARSGDFDQDGQRHRARGVAAVEGQLAGALVTADHEPVPACLPSGSRAEVVQAHKRPLVQPVTLGALATRDLLPCPRRDLPKQGVGTLGGATKAQPVVAGHRQHVAHPAGVGVRKCVHAAQNTPPGDHRPVTATHLHRRMTPPRTTAPRYSRRVAAGCTTPWHRRLPPQALLPARCPCTWPSRRC